MRDETGPDVVGDVVLETYYGRVSPLFVVIVCTVHFFDPITPCYRDGDEEVDTKSGVRQTQIVHNRHPTPYSVALAFMHEEVGGGYLENFE